VRRSALILPLLAVLALGACDTWAAETDNSSAGVQKSTSILDLMAGASERVEMQGVRRYEAHWSDASGDHTLQYRETVSADGQGQFAIDPLELLEPQLAPAPAAQFLVMQKVRERLMFRYRDFEIRDLVAFAANYEAIFTGQTVDVAGRSAERLRIQRRTVPDRRFLVDVDPDNGLVLRAREELLDGTLVSLSEYESLDLTPDLSGVVFSQSVTGETSLAPGAAVSFDDLGFVPPQPKQVPAGWSLIETARLSDPTDDRVWAKLVYSDGVDPLFFLVSEPAAPELQIAAGSSSPQSASVSALTIGTWTVLQGEIASHDVVVMGEQDDQVLADLIRSAFP
jgi:hypothetical protein